MLKNDYFLLAMKAKLYEKRAFIISLFSLVREDFSKWKDDPFPYRAVQTPTGNFFVDPISKELILIEDAPAGEPILRFKSPVELKAGDIPNLKNDVTTTIGNILFNYCCLVNAFNDKINYIEGRVNVSKIENEIAKRLEDTPESGVTRDPKYIYVDEYIKFANSLMYITNFTQLCVWCSTEKTMTPPPGLKELKESLLEKYKDNLTDPTVIAMIDAELVKYDNDYLKGDPGQNFLLNGGKALKARKRLYLMYGAEAGFQQKVGVDLIKKSLVDGWEVDKFPIMMDALRAGSFNRGAETQLGGESVKWLLRASSNFNITSEDCGTKIGKKFTVTPDNFKSLIGFNIVTEDGSKEITETEESGKYLGKTLMVRSPMYCKLDRTDFCSKCLGKKLSLNPTGLSIAVSNYGSQFMNIFLKKMHASTLSLAKLDYKTILT
jgi:hypothetical protein